MLTGHLLAVEGKSKFVFECHKAALAACRVVAREMVLGGGRLRAQWEDHRGAPSLKGGRDLSESFERNLVKMGIEAIVVAEPLVGDLKLVADVAHEMCLGIVSRERFVVVVPLLTPRALRCPSDSAHKKKRHTHAQEKARAKRNGARTSCASLCPIEPWDAL